MSTSTKQASEVGVEVVGVPVVGLALGDPGVTVGVPVVGPPVMGVPVVGVPVVGLALGDPGVTVGVQTKGIKTWWTKDSTPTIGQRLLENDIAGIFTPLRN